MTTTAIPPARMDGLSDHAQTQLRLTAARAVVLLAGSLNADYILRADRIPDNDGSTVVSVVERPGGHAGNCASALAALGVQTALLAAVGRDRDGDAIIADLADRGVDVAGVARVSSPTGRVFIPTAPDRRFMLMERGANDDLCVSHLDRMDLGDFTAIMVFDPNRAVAAAIASAADMVHPRPLLCWNPGGIYSTPSFLASARQHFDLVVLNRDEYRRMYGGDAGLPFARPGHETLLTCGEGGSCLHARPAAAEPAYEIEAHDLTGAGDAYCAGMLLARLARLEITDRLRFANAVGGLATRALGARGSLPSLAEAVECTRLRSTLPLRVSL